MENQPILKCPLNGGPCRGKDLCKCWVEIEDLHFEGCVFIASEEILTHVAVDVKRFLTSPMGRTVLSIAGALLSKGVPEIRTRTDDREDSNLPVPTKTEPR